MPFYVGKWLQDDDPRFDPGNWALPKPNAQHIKETANVEDLRVFPEDMAVVPEQIQFGHAQWTDDDSVESVWGFFYAPTINFYVRSFTPAVGIYKGFYSPLPDFYVRSFTPAVDIYRHFYAPLPNFYVRSFTPAVDIYRHFYAPEPDFYIRSFTPRDFFYLLPDDC